MNTNASLDKTTVNNQSDVLTKLLVHHLDSFMQNDLQSLMSDYTNESVFITQDATYTGLNEIKEFFTNLLLHFPKQQSQFELAKMVVKDNLGFIVWHAATPSLVVPIGTDTFIIKDDKISHQTFAGQLNFIG
ncbi:MAG: nuclear transport factor 2 family protein [Ferruginibacter sp.]